MKRTLSVVAVILAVLLGAQGQALAANFAKPFEDDTGPVTSGSGGDSCSEVWAFTPVAGYVLRAKGCFSKNGDIWRVQDAFPDGTQTFVFWENWLWSGDGPGAQWKPYRYGECTNSSGSDTWARCNKDYYESSNTNVYGGKGSKIRFQTCRRVPADNVCTPASIEEAPWINNNG
ncbi:hypothetical protein [Micromonospora lupini]|uniref:hypothetical protein n=1 Tax=Micromonospora lupini TaxID=285679 RepID=UPI0033FC8A89